MTKACDKAEKIMCYVHTHMPDWKFSMVGNMGSDQREEAAQKLSFSFVEVNVLS